MIPVSLENLADEKLVEEFLAGREPAFDLLVKRYQEKAVRLAFSLLRNFELAKEVSQNAFVKTYFGLKGFKQNSKFGTWFYRILMNAVKDEFRRRQKAWEDLRVEEVLEMIPDSSHSPSRSLVMDEEKRRLEQAVHELPENERRIFILRYFDDMPLADIADILGVALGTVKASLFHATRKIRKTLEEKPSVSKGGNV